uniref:Secreted frizzled-related protein 5-like n=1 Tax=Neogobius melanostomus TaxID=47308 RepID=A0A8C6TK68_9GOBI
MSSFFVTLFFLLMLGNSTSPSALSSGRARGDRRGFSSIRSGLNHRGNQRTSTEVEPVVGKDTEIWGDLGTDAAFRSVNSEEGGLWESRISSRCVPIPSNMALCQNIGYENMRMPNLLGHESPAEAVQQSASWLTLLARECHPDARIFLCSLFAPICLDRSISPCRSLCESVRDSCAPIMNCYGFPWPEILRCDQYPADHLMCISSITNVTVQPGRQRVPQASCRDCELEESTTTKETLETFCRNDFVVKLRLTRHKSSPASLSHFSLTGKFDVLKHGPQLVGQIRSRIELWLERDATCVRNMTRRHSQGGTFLVTGTVQGERLVVNNAYYWHKRNKALTAAARRWKQYQCRGQNRKLKST